MRMIDHMKDIDRFGYLPGVLVDHPTMMADVRRLQNNLTQTLADPGLDVYVIDNVAEYLYVQSPQEHWDIQRDFPNIMPPGPLCWFEYKMPRLSNSNGELIEMPGSHHHQYNGVLVTRIDAPKWGAWAIDEFAGARWLTAWTLVTIDKGVPALFDPITCIALDEHGRPVGRPLMKFLIPDSQGTWDKMPELTGDPRTASLAGNYRSMWPEIYPAMLALSFLHCKNTCVTTERPAIKRKARKRGDRPPRSFHVLDIRPMRQALRREGAENGAGSLARALHICRGHFKTYTAEKPLFGRVTGSFWWEQTARGTPAAGEVRKQYRVKL